MANTLLTIGGITREAVRLFLNTNAFIGNINRQYDDAYAKVGAKIGTTLRIRLPNDYVVSNGPALSVQDTAETSTTLTVATQRHVDVSFSSVDRTMSLDDYSEIILAPMMNNLAGNVAYTIMSGSEGGICNLQQNLDSNSALISPTVNTWLRAGAALDSNSAQTMNRKAILDPFTMANTVSSLTGLLNPAADIGRQYRNAKMYDALNFEWFMDQTTLTHTAGSFSSGTVSGANQTGLTLTTNAITGTLKAGDIITLASVNSVNRVTKQTQVGQLRQFVVTADVATAATSIPIYPAIIPASNGNAVQYQTVDVSPANSAVISLVTTASGTYRKNFVYAKDMVTMVTADLYMPEKGVVEAARTQKDGVAMRMLTAYVPGTDQTATRLDVLFGYLYVRPEWGCIVADTTS